jgi:hypothetical protein
MNRCAAQCTLFDNQKESWEASYQLSRELRGIMPALSVHIYNLKKTIKNTIKQKQKQ